MLSLQQQQLFISLTENKSNPGTLKQLIEQFQSTTSEKLDTAFLAYASSEWEVEIVECLINDFDISPNPRLTDENDNNPIQISPLFLASQEETNNERQIKTVQILLAHGATLENYSDEDVAKIYRIARNELPPRQTPSFLSNRIALIDVDETLALTQGGMGPSSLDWYLNSELVKALKRTGYLDIYFVTNYNPLHIPQTPQDWKNGAPSRLYLKQELIKQGFNVHGVVIPGDLMYRRGPGADYQDNVEPIEQAVMDGKSLKINEKYDPNFLKIATNDKRRKDASRTTNIKGLLFKYLLKEIPELQGKIFIFIDDSKGYLQEVSTAAQEIGEKLLSIRCVNVIGGNVRNSTTNHNDYITQICGNKTLISFAADQFRERQEEYLSPSDSTSSSSISTSTPSFFSNGHELYRKKTQTLCARTLYKWTLINKNEKYDPNFLKIATNDKRRKDASRTTNIKGLLFKYLLKEIPELQGKIFIFIDDSKGYLQEVSTAAQEIGEKLLSIRCVNVIGGNVRNSTTNHNDYITQICGNKTLISFAADQFRERQEEYLSPSDSTSSSSISTSTPSFFSNGHELYRKKTQTLCARTLYKWTLINKNEKYNYYDLDNAKKLCRLAYALTCDSTLREFILKEYSEIITKLYANPQQNPCNVPDDSIRAFDIEKQCEATFSPAEKALFSYLYAEIYYMELVLATESQSNTKLCIQRIINLLADAWLNGFDIENSQHKRDFEDFCKKIITTTSVDKNIIETIKQDRISQEPDSAVFFDFIAGLKPNISEETKSSACIIS